jgi:hypothetical protein
MYIIIIAGSGINSEAALGDAEGAQRLVLRVNEPKKTGAHSALVPKYVVMIMFIQTYTPTGLEVYVL